MRAELAKYLAKHMPYQFEVSGDFRNYLVIRVKDGSTMVASFQLDVDGNEEFYMVLDILIPSVRYRRRGVYSCLLIHVSNFVQMHGLKRGIRSNEADRSAEASMVWESLISKYPKQVARFEHYPKIVQITGLIEIKYEFSKNQICEDRRQIRTPDHRIF